MEIKNKPLDYLFDFFDLPVRLLYTQLGPFSKILGSLFFWKLYTSSYQKLDSQFEKIIGFLQKANISISKKTVLEIGPGNSYINAYNFLMNKVKKVVLVDKFPRYFENKHQQEFFKKELNFIKDKYKKKALPFFDKKGKFKKECLLFINSDLTETKSLLVDFICSVSVLEHIRNVSANIKKMAEILRPGGFMYHKIDLRDHYDFNNPFLFYKYSDRVWNKYLTKEGHSYTNRWRYDDFIKEFRENNFEIILEEITRFHLGHKMKINKKFKRYKNLDVGVMEVLLRKT